MIKVFVVALFISTVCTTPIRIDELTYDVKENGNRVLRFETSNGIENSERIRNFELPHQIIDVVPEEFPLMDTDGTGIYRTFGEDLEPLSVRGVIPPAVLASLVG